VGEDAAVAVAVVVAAGAATGDVAPLGKAEPVRGSAGTDFAVGPDAVAGPAVNVEADVAGETPVEHPARAPAQQQTARHSNTRIRVRR